jgi:hypothetical protein
MNLPTVSRASEFDYKNAARAILPRLSATSDNSERLHLDMRAAGPRQVKWRGPSLVESTRNASSTATPKAVTRRFVCAAMPTMATISAYS